MLMLLEDFGLLQEIRIRASVHSEEDYVNGSFSCRYRYLHSFGTASKAFISKECLVSYSKLMVCLFSSI